MRQILFVLVALALLLLSGCVWYVAPVMPPPGLIYSNVQAPIDTDANKTDVSKKSGESSSMSILGLVAFGDASVEAAAKEGQLSRVDHVDYNFLNVLFVYQRFTTKVYGE